MASDIYEVAHQEQSLWEDALDEENLQQVCSILQSTQPFDSEMMCDIQRLVGRLIAKAEQLLGKKMVLKCIMYDY